MRCVVVLLNRTARLFINLHRELAKIMSPAYSLRTLKASVRIVTLRLFFYYKTITYLVSHTRGSRELISCTGIVLLGTTNPSTPAI